MIDTIKKILNGEIIDEIFDIGPWHTSDLGVYYERQIQQKRIAFIKANVAKNRK